MEVQSGIPKGRSLRFARSLSQALLHLPPLLRSQARNRPHRSNRVDGTDDIENAIPVCFECHAEIHSYNDKHPRGRKFSSEELRAHRTQWLKLCEEHPEVLLGAIRDADVGPLQALIDELDFNATTASSGHHSVQDGVFHEHHCKFHEHEFLRAIHEGSISILRDEIRGLLLEAYRAMGAANVAIEAKGHHPIHSEGWATGCSAVARLVVDARPKIAKARDELLRFLSSDNIS
ncbi:MAG: hypothetical protein WBE74_22405 [Terracidiphilus sp.]